MENASDDNVATLQTEGIISLPPLTERANPDFVLVWNESIKECPDASTIREIFELNLDKEGLIVRKEISESAPNLGVLKIWAPLEVLKRYSEILKIRLPMIPLSEDSKCQNVESSYHGSSTSELLYKKPTSLFWDLGACWRILLNGISFKLDSELFPERCRRLTGLYSRDKEYLFDVNEANMYEIFPLSMRTRIVQYILKRTSYKTEEELERDDFAFGYERLVQKQVYEAGYPLHDGTINTKGSTHKLLSDHWAKMSICLKHQPLDTLRDYFGVNIALYFAWLGYYTGMLGIASVFGFLCFIYGLVSSVTDLYVNDVCNKTAEIVMCPVCDTGCDTYHVSERCTHSKFAHLFDNDFTVAFALLMSVWTAVFLEYWKRYAMKITHRWDLTNFDVRDFTPRPEYIAELKRIYPKGTSTGQVENGEDVKAKFDFELRIPFWKRKLPFRLLSYSTVLLLVVLALSALVGVIMYRLWLIYWLSKGTNTSDHHDIILKRYVVTFTAAFLNLTFIVVFGKVYERIAIKLTEMELPRTQLEFDASYTLKIYLLQFINNYSSIFYVAFFKGVYAGHPQNYHKLFGKLRQEECGISCMPELCIQLVVILIGKQAKSMFMEAFLPWCKRGVKRVSTRLKVASAYIGDSDSQSSCDDALTDSRKASIVKSSPQWLEDYDLLEWDHFLLTDAYLEMVLQFGLVTIFVTAFPLAPFFALINNLLEVRVDANKMLRHYRRPVGIRVKDIGVWSNILEGIVKVAILSNACIIALTSNFIPKLMYRYFLFDKNHTNYGTLHGYLNHSLTVYHMNDLEPIPERSVFENVSPPVCHYAAYRYDYTSDKKYEYRLEHWQIWLARVIFIIMYENVVAVILLLIHWIIPDVPRNLLAQMQREQRMVNDLIQKRERDRFHKSVFMSARCSRRNSDYNNDVLRSATGSAQSIKK